MCRALGDVESAAHLGDTEFLVLSKAIQQIQGGGHGLESAGDRPLTHTHMLAARSGERNHTTFTLAGAAIRRRSRIRIG